MNRLFHFKTEFKEELASSDPPKCGEGMESGTKSRSGVQENRATSERIGRGKSSRRDAKACSSTRDSKVSFVGFRIMLT